MELKETPSQPLLHLQFLLLLILNGIERQKEGLIRTLEERYGLILNGIERID